MIARRAGGSMRDAQSLLEQLLSFGGERLTVELVQQQLGIASDDRTLDLLDALSRRDAAEALRSWSTRRRRAACSRPSCSPGRSNSSAT